MYLNNPLFKQTSLLVYALSFLLIHSSVGQINEHHVKLWEKVIVDFRDRSSVMVEIINSADASGTINKIKLSEAKKAIESFDQFLTMPYSIDEEYLAKVLLMDKQIEKLMAVIVGEMNESKWSGNTIRLKSLLEATQHQTEKSIKSYNDRIKSDQKKELLYPE